MNDYIEKQIESEVTRLEKVQRIQEEVQNLNKSINACIDIVSSSVGNEHTLERLRRLKEENTMSYARVNNDIEETLENTKDNVNQLRIEQKALIEQEKEEETEEKIEDEKGSES